MALDPEVDNLAPLHLIDERDRLDEAAATYWSSSGFLVEVGKEREDRKSRAAAQRNDVRCLKDTLPFRSQLFGLEVEVCVCPK